MENKRLRNILFSIVNAQLLNCKRMLLSNYKKYVIFSTFLFLILLSGCIGDNMKECPAIEEDNTTLLFEYSNFPHCIEKVNVGIFNSDGQFILEKTVDKQMLSKFQGISMHLYSGIYTAVCWGNAMDHTTIYRFSDGWDLSRGKLYHPNYVTTEKISTNDSLYYGKVVFTKEKNVDILERITFKPSHIKMKIAVIGLSNTEPRTPPIDYPVIRINNLDAVSDFEMTTSGGPVSYYPFVHVDTDNTMGIAYCNVLRFTDDNSVTIDVLRSAGNDEILHRVLLQEFMQANNIHVVDGQEVYISMKITFVNGNITVTLGGWGNTPVTPGW